MSQESSQSMKKLKPSCLIFSRKIQFLINKATSSSCEHKVAAIAINKKGEVIGRSYNKPRIARRGGGIHAEMALMKRYGKVIDKIFILRTNKTGGLLPISACSACAKAADSLGIQIVSLTEDFIIHVK